MSFITQDVVNQLSAQNSPVMVAATTLGPYYTAVAYTWTITNFDSYVTYTLTSSNGSVLLSGQTITFTPTSVGPAQFTINARTITFTISTITNFIATLVSGSTESGRAVAVDASDNIYVAGNISTTSGDILVVKYDSQGFIQWQKSLGDASANVATDIAVDASGNVYIVGESLSNRPYIAKLDANGVLQWQYYVPSGFNSDIFNGVMVDSNGDIIVTGAVTYSSSVFQVLYRWSASGSLLTQKGSQVTGVSAQGYAVAQDSAGNYFVGGEGSNGYIVKYNSSYNFVTDARLTSTISYIGGVVTDSAGNVYCAITLTSSAVFIIMKLDTNLTTLWARELSNVTGAEACNDIAIDSAGNVYGVGYFNALGTQDILIAKYDSAGVIQWQRQLTATGTQNALSVTINNAGNIVITGSQANDLLLAVLPSDGSKTGTYVVGGVTFTYSAGTMTAATSAVTMGSVSTTTATSTFTPTAAALTTTTTTATSNSVPI